MKKTVVLILGGTVTLTLSLFLSICVISQSNAESDSGLFETNVEALAGVEHWAKGYLGPSELTHCSCSGTMTPIKEDTDDDTQHLPSK